MATRANMDISRTELRLPTTQIVHVSVMMLMSVLGL